MALSVVTYRAHHFTLINSWLADRGIASISAQELPKDGLMIYGREGYLAGGFLRQCEGGIALMDSYITNPNAPAELRNEALEKMTGELLRVAKNKGYTKVIAYSADSHTIERAVAHGFAIIDQALLGKAL